MQILMRVICYYSCLIGLVLCCFSSLVVAQSLSFNPQIQLPRTNIQTHELGIVVNIADPDSVAIADYYMARRGIPAENRFEIALNPRDKVIDPSEFEILYKKLNDNMGSHIQALALTWATPYRVGCMSISSAFAFGFHPKFCAKGCRFTEPSGYFDHKTTRPFSDLHFRPTMMIAGKDVASTKLLIDRGAKADGQWPRGNAYLLSTSDRQRNVRSVLFPKVERTLGHRLKIHNLKQDAIVDKNNILFYFLGAAKVDHLGSLQFVPGAVADHLTSFGGQLTDSSQMSSLRWIDAGATGSYGNALEPCNYLEKFPNPGVLMDQYLSGASLIEAYWKSVVMPGQGNFIGEPLAAPFNGYRLLPWRGIYLLSSPKLKPGVYLLEGAFNEVAPFETLGRFTISELNPYIPLLPPYKGIYRVTPSLFGE